MSNLIFHIGLSKCASTSIQKALRDVPGYLGRMSSDRIGNSLVTELLRISPVNRLNFNRVNEKALNSWRHSVQKHLMERGFLDRNVVISREEFSKPIDDYTGLLGFLAKIRGEVWTSGKVKVIVVLRNQPDKIASEYAQRSSKRFNANQEDFHIYLRSRLHSKSLDYGELILRLHQEMGVENVLTLFVEEAGEVSFWQKIIDFCEIPDNELCAALIPSNKRNVKSLGSNKWKICSPCREIDAKGFAIKVLTWTWPSSMFPAVRAFCLRAIAKLYTVACRAVHFFEWKRESLIDLDKGLQEAIKNRFFESNNVLAKQLNRDISHLGYFGSGAKTASEQE